ncbi:wax ester/triacylglycerol synthase domain-containing protein, partial [Acinetobacter baumannii]
MADADQPLTPAGRLFVQPTMEQVINCAIAGENPLDVSAVRSEIQNSIMVKHPRFCSLMVRDSCGREYWRRTQVDLDRHIIVIDKPVSDVDTCVSDEDAVNSYISELSVSSPLPTDKPLWEVHLLMAHNTAVCRLHHALGDGISLMSMMLSLCRRIDDPEMPPTLGGVGKSSEEPRRRW